MKCVVSKGERQSDFFKAPQGTALPTIPVPVLQHIENTSYCSVTDASGWRHKGTLPNYFNVIMMLRREGVRASLVPRLSPLRRGRAWERG